MAKKLLLPLVFKYTVGKCSCQITSKGTEERKVLCYRFGVNEILLKV